MLPLLFCSAEMCDCLRISLYTSFSVELKHRAFLNFLSMSCVGELSSPLASRTEDDSPAPGENPAQQIHYFWQCTKFYRLRVTLATTTTTKYIYIIPVFFSGFLKGIETEWEGVHQPHPQNVHFIASWKCICEGLLFFENELIWYPLEPEAIQMCKQFGYAKISN